MFNLSGLFRPNRSGWGMKHCVINWLADDEVAISGIVDEYADFSEFARCAQNTLTVDFAEVTRMNSSGIRSWIQAIMKHKIKLVLRNCSSVVVEQFSMIPEFVGKNGFVESFYVHYHCVSCQYETKRLFVPGRDIQISESPQVEPHLPEPCPKCADVVELDHNPEIYFAFLRFMKPRQAS